MYNINNQLFNKNVLLAAYSKVANKYGGYAAAHGHGLLFAAGPGTWIHHKVIGHAADIGKGGRAVANDVYILHGHCETAVFYHIAGLYVEGEISFPNLDLAV